MTAYAMPTPTADATAVVGRRIGAWFIDLLIYLVIAFLFTAALGVKSETVQLDNATQAEAYCDVWRSTHNGGFCLNLGDSSSGSAFTVENPGGSTFIWLGHLVAYALLQGVLGGSLGKLAVGLRVVDEQGNQAGIGKSFLRTILWVGDAITCAIPILGGILLVSTKGHRRLGDMAAGTYVVDKGQVGRPPLGGYGTAGYQAAPGYGEAGPAGWAPPPTGAPQGGTWSPTPAATPTAASSAPTGDGGPTWDEARNAYIQYDRDRSEWVQWSDQTQAWGPISQ